MRIPSLAREILSLLSRRERVQLAGLGLAMLLMALVETVGVASILPFMQIVSDPGVIHANPWLRSAYERLGFADTDSFLVFTGIALLAMIAFNNAFSALTVWLTYRFAWGQNHRLAVRLMSTYLDEPYESYLERNTATLSRNLMNEVGSVITGVLIPVLRAIARSVAVILILGLLAWVDTRLALIVTTVFGGAYAVIYLGFRRRQQRLGLKRIEANSARFQAAQEAFGGIKTVKALGREASMVDRFRTPSKLFSTTAASNQVVAQLPRYVLETIAFGAIVVVVLYFLRIEGNVARMLPTISLYAFAGYRLMPALNELFTHVVNIRFHRPAVTELHRDLTGRGWKLAEGPRDEPASEDAGSWALVRTFRRVSIENVFFAYKGGPPVLRGIDVELPRGSLTGLVGTTGSGKTTLVDILLGLLPPTRGHVLVDGERLTLPRAPAWRKQCGYVPQEIFLLDDTIRANVAFGVPAREVDDDAVRRAARIAQIADFVDGLRDGYETRAGERGVRLSGGQRQRIGIARALYHDPHLLILDEATNALDGATEAAVMRMIHELAGVKTLVIIAHRLSTVRACDAIHVLERGRIVASGTYAALVAQNAAFRVLSGLEAAHHA